MTTVRRVPGPAAGPLRRAVKSLDDLTAKVGWFETSHYPNGVPVALVAAVHEYGWPAHNIPPRLGMRATAEACKAAWGEVSKVVAGRIVKGQMTPYQAMEVIGAKAAADVRKHIAEVKTPPLKVETVKRRLAGKKQGNVVSVSIAKPLVATGLLLNTLTHVTETK